MLEETEIILVPDGTQQLNCLIWEQSRNWRWWMAGGGLDIQWVHSAWHWPLIRPRKLELVRLQFVHLITLGLPDITPEWHLNII